ncbi:hypothetical protein EDD27_5993 [Nonomuraea polychroma]|uniref:Uncharacterized protein n=1 Tax=Nonomuraea polychroma TaxID=46176 RepID=A0A438MC74_9ACTN|nr:hypothetical protein [Nonomuraea polychroma]RVX43316.1 hypothetical protein EDD27_5993 [Nonomuraea polychroma]
MTPHQCACPSAPEGTTKPWRCPHCGLLWEPLPSSPVRQAKRKISINKDVVVITVLLAAGAVCLGLLAVSLEAAIAAMCVIGLGSLVQAAVGAFRRGEDPGRMLGGEDSGSEPGEPETEEEEDQGDTSEDDEKET